MATIKVNLVNSCLLVKNLDNQSQDSMNFPNQYQSTILQDYGTNNYCRKGVMQFNFSAYTLAQLANVKLKIYFDNADQVGQFYINKIKRTDWAYNYANKTYYKSGGAWGTIMASNTSSDIETSSPAQITENVLSAWANTWKEFDISAMAIDAKNNTSGILTILLSHSPVVGGTGVVVIRDNGYTDSAYRPYAELTIPDSGKFLQFF